MSPRSEILLMIERGEPEQKIIRQIKNVCPAAVPGWQSCGAGEPWPCDILLGVDNGGNTALHYAAVWGAAEVVKCLLPLKANPRARTTDPHEYDGLHTPLELAAAFGSEDVMLVLRRAEQWSGEELAPALVAAAARGSVALDELLLPQAKGGGVEEVADAELFSEKVLFQALAAAVTHDQISAVDVLVDHKDLLGSGLSPELHSALRLKSAAEEDGSMPGDKVDTVGEAMLFLALRNEFDKLATHLIVALGADGGIGDLQREELHVWGEAASEHPFGLALRRKAFGTATAMLPAGFILAPGTALYASLCVTEAAQKEERRVAVVDPPRARKMKKLALEAQLMGLQLLQTLPDARQVDLLNSTEGEAYVRLAGRLDSAVVLSQPVVQKEMENRWYGTLLLAISSGKGINQWGDPLLLPASKRLQLLLLAVCLLLPATMLLYPVIALVPAVEGVVLTRLRSFGEPGERWGWLRETGYVRGLSMWWEDLWLPGIPIFKATVSHGCTLAFASFIVASGADHPAIVLAWSAGLVLSSLAQLASGVLFIRWGAKMMLLAGALLIVSASLAIVDGDDDSQLTDLSIGFASLGVMLLFGSTLAQAFLQSAFFGPMITSIMQMLSDTITWLATFCAALVSFVFAMWINEKVSDTNTNDDGSALGILVRYFFNVGLKISPLTGAKPLKTNDDQTPFEFVLIQLYWLVISTMLYSLLVAIFSTRLTKDAASRLPNFHRTFCKLVFTEHSKAAVPPPLEALTIPARLFAALLASAEGPTAGEVGETSPKELTISEQKEKKEFGVAPTRRMVKDGAVMRASLSMRYKDKLFTPEKQWHDLGYRRENTPVKLANKMKVRPTCTRAYRQAHAHAYTGVCVHMRTCVPAHVRTLMW